MKTETRGLTIQFGPRVISYTLHRTDRNNLRVVMTPDLAVDVYAPENTNHEEILKAVQKKAPWIARSLDKAERYLPLPTPKLYLSGETLVYLGRQYRLKVETGPRQPAKLKGQFLWIWIEDTADTQKIKRALNAWYRKRAQETLCRHVRECAVITARHDVPEPKLAIRNMRRRWGSCSPAGRITLNTNLVQVPIHCIQYVIMHELCHLKHHNHSKAFYSLLTRCQPDWRKRKETLYRFRLSRVEGTWRNHDSSERVKAEASGFLRGGYEAVFSGGRKGSIRRRS